VLINAGANMHVPSYLDSGTVVTKSPDEQ
jgi:hypothetical protein